MVNIPLSATAGLANFLRTKVANMRLLLLLAHLPVINHDLSQPTNDRRRRSVTIVDDITHLINMIPAKSYLLDPISTWLLKSSTTHISPAICHLWNLSPYILVFPNPTEVHTSPSKPKEE